MSYADRVKETTNVTGTGSATLAGASAGYRAISAAYNIGARVPYVIDGGAQWEVGSGTLADASTLARTTVLASSNGGAPVNFSAGEKAVFATALAADLNKMQTTDTLAFATAIPLTAPGARYMPQTPVTGALTFTIAGGAVLGALVYLRLVANGTNAPSFAAFKEWNGSSGYDNRNGIVNIVQFFFDGSDYWHSIAQQVGAQAVDTTAPLLSAASGSATGPTTASGSVTTNEGNGTLYYVTSTASTLSAAAVKAGASMAISSSGAKAVSATGLTASTTYFHHFVHVDAAANESAVLSSASFTTTAIDNTAPILSAPTGAQTGTTTATIGVTTNEANGTLYYRVTANSTETATTVKAGQTQVISSTGVKTASITGLTAATTYYAHFVHVDASNNESTVSSSASFTTAAAATAPGAPTIGTATGGDASASVTFTAPASDGGSAITGYTVTSSPGGLTGTGTASPINVTGLTNGVEYTFTVTATNSVNTGAVSAASNAVTPAAAQPADYPHLTSLVTMTKTADNPDAYLGSGAALPAASTAIGGITTKSLAPGVDGYFDLKVLVPNEVLFGFRLQNTVGGWGGIKMGIYASGAGTGANASVPAGYRRLRDGTNLLKSEAPAANDILRVHRTGNILKIALARAATPTTFVDMETFDNGSSPQAWVQVVCSGSASVQLLNQVGFT